LYYRPLAPHSVLIPQRYFFKLKIPKQNGKVITSLQHAAKFINVHATIYLIIVRFASLLYIQLQCCTKTIKGLAAVSKFFFIKRNIVYTAIWLCHTPAHFERVKRIFSSRYHFHFRVMSYIQCVNELYVYQLYTVHKTAFNLTRTSAQHR
jgi:hypothetical protein